MTALSLNKTGESCTLDASQAISCNQEIKISLRWRKGSLMKRIFGRGPVDLDLGCYCEMHNGKRTLIDRLQFGNDGGLRDQPTRQGCYTQEPYVWHGGNDRGEKMVSEEVLLINPAGLGSLRRMLLYVFIYDGAPCWNELDMALTISVPGCSVVAVRPEWNNTEKRFCAMASLDPILDGKMRVTNLTTYHAGHADCDRYYQWNFKYQ